MFRQLFIVVLIASGLLFDTFYFADSQTQDSNSEQFDGCDDDENATLLDDAEYEALLKSQNGDYEQCPPGQVYVKDEPVKDGSIRDSIKKIKMEQGETVEQKKQRVYDILKKRGITHITNEDELEKEILDIVNLPRVTTTKDTTATTITGSGSRNEKESRLNKETETETEKENEKQLENILFVGDELHVPGILTSGHGIAISLNDQQGAIKLIMQSDCNLVLYVLGTNAKNIVWQSQTNRSDSECSLHLNSNWTIDIRTGTGLKIWSKGILNAYLEQATVLRIKATRSDDDISNILSSLRLVLFGSIESRNLIM